MFVIPAFLRRNGRWRWDYHLESCRPEVSNIATKTRKDHALRKQKMGTEACRLFSDLHMCNLARVCIIHSHNKCAQNN